MPLYECTRCHAVENTALTNFWMETQFHKKPALCSACDPEIGEWHGQFPKLTVEEYRKQHPDSLPIEYPVGDDLP
jgi:uncharacterized CHY-type Zn-finger protein